MPERLTVEYERRAVSFGHWSEVELVRSLDGYSAASLSGPFDHDRLEVRRAFAPLEFPRVAVKIEGELVLTGIVKDVAPDVQATISSVGVTVYSIAQQLTEVCVDPERLPLEFNGLDLRQIASAVVTASIGEESVFDGSPGGAFARVRAEPDADIHSFIVDLARPRGFLLSDAPSGALWFRAEAPLGAPVARLKGQPLVRVRPRFEPSNWFSTVTARAKRKAGKTGSKYTEVNPLYRAEHPRAHTLRLDDVESADAPTAAKAAIGRMIASVVSYTIEDLPTWRDPSGQLWRPNTTVTLLAPEAMVYRETELVIRTVTLRQNPEAETATLELVLPGAFGGVLPRGLPWEF
jgi:prophage tail gpP-like protein